MSNPLIPKQIFSLLNLLRENNNREWFQENKQKYVDLEEQFKTFGNHLQNEILRADVLDRMKVYRLYRDVRFSKDKTPYHLYRSISFFRAGKGEYYLHLEPRHSYVMIGYWDIQKDELKRLREEFEYDATEFREIFKEPKFRKHFKNLEPFELKTAPRGFDKHHENIDLIRKKSLMVKKAFTEEEVLRKDFFDKVLDSFQVATPLLTYIDEVLTTDSNGMPLNMS